MNSVDLRSPPEGKITYQMSDNDFSEEMQKFKEQLFENSKHISQEMISFTTFISRAYVD